ncbi:MAG: hypothetical protein PWR29_1464 [Methanolobus sp.]|nr:hypothetical protein [Methanolobus sp.]
MILFLIFVIIRINHYSKDFEKEDLIKKYNTVWNLNLATSNFIVLFFIFYLIYFSVVFKIGFNLEEYLFTSVGFFLLDGGTLVLLFCSVYLNMKVYKQNIKLYLNTKYGKNYPHVYVSTNGTNEATGQVSDIFNSKYLILNNEGTEEIILWSSIDLLKIQEYKQLKSNSQKSIFEY